jgi:transcriptional regulator with GAF, ATPase, and Fis domain
LQEGKVRPLGSTEEIDVDVRIIAATNKDLEQEIAEERFREDLYYRLSVIPMHLPPLRERREDIPLLARAFLERFRKTMEKPIEGIEPEAMRLLEAYDWPGNVRELENTIERSVALEIGRHISVQVLPARISGYSAVLVAERTGKDGAVVIPEEGVNFEEHIGNTERRYLVAALERAGGVQRRAAELLKMSYHSFRHYAKKHRIQ